MSQKPPIYWTLATRTCRAGREVLAVTSEKPSQIYGRDEHGEATHRRRSDCVGRFPTEAAARVVIDEMRALEAHHEALQRPIRQRLRDMEAEERRAIQELIARAVQGHR